ncbi:MAG: sulfatase [Planctomycetota bacterium]
MNTALRPLVAVALSVLVHHAQAQPQERASPNFIFIVADDLGWTSLSFSMDDRFPDAKSRYHTTPHLAELAEQSTRFSNAYAASPVCSPTRYSILLGQTPARLGKTIVRGPSRIDLEQPGLPDVLKSIDDRYMCAHLGKWHIDADPESFGYDISDGRTTNREGGFTSSGPDRRTREWGGYPAEDPKLSASLTTRAIEFLDDRATRSEPFFLQLSYYAVHSDIVYTERSFQNALERPEEPNHSNAGFSAMLTDFDNEIGRLLSALHRHGLHENTYIFFFSDNGGVPSIPPEVMRGRPHQNGFNAPLRRGKWDLTEGGIRIPFLVTGPAVVAGAQCDVPVSTIDLLPTLADLAGNPAAIPASTDGGSLAPLLSDSSMRGVTRPHGDTLVFHFPHWNMMGLGEPHSAVRSGRYKLIRFPVLNRSLLFDLHTDIGEQNDLSSELPDVASELEHLLEQYLLHVAAEKPLDSFTRDIADDGQARTRFLDEFD